VKVRKRFTYIISFLFLFFILFSLRNKFLINLVKKEEKNFKYTLLKGKGRILIFSPHSDDETLGTGGLIATSLNEGFKIKVVILTNGDGFRYAAERLFKDFSLSPQQYMKFAYIRQKESLNALAHLGLNKKDVVFLGYPDRGLKDMWIDFFSCKRLYTSKFTKTNYSPYYNSFTKKSPYCGISVLKDITKIIKEFKPSYIFIPHPEDDHPDHWATNNFVILSLENLIWKKESFAKKVKIFTYLVHRGDWPLPQGKYLTLPLVPPLPLTKLNYKWEKLNLSPDVRKLKYEAIFNYKSQTSIMKRFLTSFARKNEIFASYNNVKSIKVNESNIVIDGKKEDWQNIKPLIFSPLKDNPARYIISSLDLKKVYVANSSKNLFLRIDVRKKPSSKANYQVFIYSFKRNMINKSPLKVIIIPPQRIKVYGGKKEGIIFKSFKVIELKIPLKNLDFPKEIYMGVFSNFYKVTIDKTAWKIIKLK
jgi:LmbE family N-acetylglucosaminyl deacetylase